MKKTIILLLLGISFKAFACTPPTLRVLSGVSICAGESVVLQALVSGGNSPYTYKWSNGATTDTTTVRAYGDSIFTLTVKNSCGDSTTQKVMVYVFPPALSVCCDTAIGKGGSAILKALYSKDCSWTPSSSLNCDNCDTVTATPTVTTTYTLTAIDTNGCVDKKTVTITVGPSAILNIPGIGYLNIYPNPTSASFILMVPKQVLIKLYDITGRLLFSETGNEGEIIFGEKLTPGIYYLFLDGIPATKLIKI